MGRALRDEPFGGCCRRWPRATLRGMDDRTLSKRLSYLLRHAPHEAGLTLQKGGWVPLAPVLKSLRVTREQLERVVAENDKGRFSLRLTEQGEEIRANQGHSVPVELELQPQEPPPVLYHGTYAGTIAAIMEQGLKRGRPLTALRCRCGWGSSIFQAATW